MVVLVTGKKLTVEPDSEKSTVFTDLLVPASEFSSGRTSSLYTLNFPFHSLENQRRRITKTSTPHALKHDPNRCRKLFVSNEQVQNA